MTSPPLPSDQGFVDVTFTVEPNYAGWRLDRYLCEKIRRLSRTRVQRIIERDLVADRRSRPEHLLRPGLALPPAPPRAARARDVPLAGAGRAVPRRRACSCSTSRPGCRFTRPRATTRARWSRCSSERTAPASGDPAHRLDRETSGLRGVRADRRGLPAPDGAFRRGEVQKEYLAIVEGQPAGRPSRWTRPSPRAPS